DDGLARTACGPPWKASENDVNGTCGRSSKTVVIWPVAWSSVTCPLSLTSTPLPAAETNSRYGIAKNTLPGSGCASSGVANVTVPICDAAGHASAANWSSEQTASPLATPGDRLVPTGSAICAFFTCDWWIAPPSGTLTEIVAPLGT